MRRTAGAAGCLVVSWLGQEDLPAAVLGMPVFCAVEGVQHMAARESLNYISVPPADSSGRVAHVPKLEEPAVHSTPLPHHSIPKQPIK